MGCSWHWAARSGIAASALTIAGIKDLDTLLSPANLRERPAATRQLAILSTVGGTSLIGIGAYLTGIHHAGGVFVLAIGAADTLLSLAIIPVARRRAKEGLTANLSKTNLPTLLSIFSICLITPGISDALDNRFSVSSAVFIALGCAVYVAAFAIALHRRRLRRNDRSAQQDA